MPRPEVFFVTPELQQVLENQPAKPPRSILDPFRAFILRWRREGRAYREIQQILAVECKVRVHHETLRRFINRRSKPRKVKPELEIEPATIPEPGAHASANPPAGKPGKLSPEEAAQQRALIQALRNKPVAVPEVRKRYEYNPDEPLTLERTKKDEKP